MKPAYWICGENPYRDALALLSEAGAEGDPRAQVLLEAARCILTDRNGLYGEPEDNFSNIAPYQTSWLKPKLKEGEVVDALDVALLTAGVKLGRLHTGKHVRDTWVDLVGYIACAFRVSELSRPKVATAPQMPKMNRREASSLAEKPREEKGDTSAKVKVAPNLWELKDTRSEVDAKDRVQRQKEEAERRFAEGHQARADAPTKTPQYPYQSIFDRQY
jgi:hypothetical protein